MAWYKFWKTWRNGGYAETYQYLSDDEDFDIENIKYYVEEWTDRVGGGHNYGYQYDFEKIDKPPKEWIEKEIKNVEKDIENSQKFLKELILLYRSCE